MTVAAGGIDAGAETGVVVVGVTVIALLRTVGYPVTTARQFATGAASVGRGIRVGRSVVALLVARE